MKFSSNQQYKGTMLAPTPVSDHKYSGLTLDPSMRGSLSSHGAFIPSSIPTRDNHSQGDEATESLTSLHNTLRSPTLNIQDRNMSFSKMDRKISAHTGTNDSPFSSDAEIHPSSGVPLNQFELNQSESNMPTTTLPQQANFSQLAEHRGIHEWNNSVFDDRWLLQPEEMWNLETRRDSILTGPPKRITLKRTTARNGHEMNSRTEGSQRSSAQEGLMQRVVRGAEEKDKDYRDRQAFEAPAEEHRDEYDETLAASEKLAISQKGNFIYQ